MCVVFGLLYEYFIFLFVDDHGVDHACNTCTRRTSPVFKQKLLGISVKVALASLVKNFFLLIHFLFWFVNFAIFCAPGVRATVVRRGRQGAEAEGARRRSPRHRDGVLVGPLARKRPAAAGNDAGDRPWAGDDGDEGLADGAVRLHRSP